MNELCRIQIAIQDGDVTQPDTIAKVRKQLQPMFANISNKAEDLRKELCFQFNLAKKNTKRKLTVDYMQSKKPKLELSTDLFSDIDDETLSQSSADIEKELENDMEKESQEQVTLDQALTIVDNE